MIASAKRSRGMGVAVEDIDFGYLWKLRVVVPIRM